MASSLTRRGFIRQAALGGAVATLTRAPRRGGAQETPHGQIVVGVMGLSRGAALAANFARQTGVQIKYVCDVDSSRAESCAAQVGALTGTAPQAIGDFRRMLDDRDVHAIVNATPNHWHAPATILACAAGKHVYVEKPCCHNPHEGELMVQAARKNRRAVQMGSQRRSGPGTRRAMARLAEGAIGRVYLARSWYTNARGSLGHGQPAPVPPQLNYELWQGPAPRRPYRDNRIPYNWHWFWHWGNGELGNNGVHTLDLCRWGIGADYPLQVTSSGGRYHWDDDQETPDTQTVCYEFEGKRAISWEGLSCNKHRAGFVAFYGDQGTLELASDGSHVIFDAQDKEVEQHQSASLGDREHIVNFLDAIRNDTPLELNAEIDEGYKSTLLCHLGNIAQRVGRALQCDPQNGRILGDEPAMSYWQREYEPGWEPKV